MKNNNNPHIRQLIKMKKMYFKTEDKNVIEIFDKINSYLSNPKCLPLREVDILESI